MITTSGKIPFSIKIVWGFLGVLFVFLCLAPPPCHAGTKALALTQDQPVHALSPHVDILMDPDGSLTLDQVLSRQAGRFVPNPGDTISIGRTAAAVWIRFKLINPPEDPYSTRHQWFLEVGKQGMGSLDLFIPMASGRGPSQYRKIEFGSWRSRPVDHITSRTSAVALPDIWNTQAFFFLRVKSDTSVNFPLRVFSSRGMISHLVRDNYAFGLLFGILLGMILYNFSIFLFLRDRTYLTYVLYIASMFWYLSLVYGQFEILFKPSRTFMDQIYFVAAGAVWIFGGTFSRLFLSTRTHAPVMDRMIILVMGGGIVVAAAAFAGFTYLAHTLNTIMGMVGPLVAIIAAVRVWQKNFSPATYFLAAWLVLMTGAILYCMGGVLIPRSPVTVYTFAAGAGIEAVLLSLALADRIRMLQTEKEMLTQREHQLRQAAVTDHLTGLFNRRLLLTTLNRETRVADSDTGTFSLLILDVDNFKIFNDTYGHPEGDKVLKVLAGILSDHLREKDFPCRYGGEEFAVVLPRVGIDQALRIAERIRHAFSEKVFTPSPGKQVQVTVSIGAAEFEPQMPPEMLIRLADKALYQAKNLGRNQVTRA